MAIRRRQQSERTEQANVIKLYRAVGGKVYVIGTTRKKGERCPHCKQFVPNTDHGTHQTPGLADLLVFFETRGDVPGAVLFHEVKAARGRLSDDQKVFRALCQATATAHVVGGLDAAIEFLVRTGRARTESFPHYRLPKPAGDEGGH